MGWQEGPGGGTPVSLPGRVYNCAPAATHSRMSARANLKASSKARRAESACRRTVPTASRATVLGGARPPAPHSPHVSSLLVSTPYGAFL